WFFGPPFISLWLGQGCEPAVYALRILLFSLPFFFLSALAMIVLLVRRQRWALVWIYGTGFMFNVTGNILLQPAFGMTAAAWLTGATELVVLILLGFALFRTKKEQP
ncbi:MAG: polysaccharide biosynthesis C-terminal domain-containing protein, partial [bacterium]|nr:polysaccharide biosynthesis C-terminal domain-containing protein [bacterium]